MNVTLNTVEVDERTARVLVLGELAIMPGTKLTAAKLANRPTLRTVPMPVVRAAAQTLVERGLVELGIGYGGADAYMVKG